MMEWASPWWLCALPAGLAPLIAWWRPHVLRFSTLSSSTSGRSARSWLAIVPPMLEALAIVLAVLALARPQLVMRETVRESDGVDILLAIDTSGSMAAPDMGAGLRATSRLDAARIVMARFVGEREYDRVGLLVFGAEAFVQVPLTLDHTGLIDFIGQLDIGMAGKQATAVGDAIAIACKRMKELEAPSKVVILVTDGRSNAGQIRPDQAANAAKALGIKVYTIGVGGDDIDVRSLSYVAKTTGGRYFQATDFKSLDSVYAEINALEKTTAKVKEYVHRDELYLRALFPSLILYLVVSLLNHTWLRRLP